MLYEKKFRIGDFCFRMGYTDGIPLPTNYLAFETEQEIPEYTYRLRIVDSLPIPEGEVIARRPDLVVCKQSGMEQRLIGIKGRNSFYAFFQEVSHDRAEVMLAVQEISDLNIDPVFTSLFALERQMIRRDSLILHCAYVKYQNKAILFSAPSETGKSTQANLWEKHRGSRTINGDRALLKKIDQGWMACGWPVCGTSGICNAEDTPIGVIVMLCQGKSNYVEHLSPVQAFVRLYGQITINQWDQDFVQRVIQNLEDLVIQIPVYQLTCDMTEDAVKCLESAIFL